MNAKICTSLFVFSALVIGCTTSPKDPLIGKWEAVDQPDFPATVELFEDGSLIVAIAEGSWTVLDDGRLQIHVISTEGEETDEVEFSIVGDKLTTTNSAGEVEELIRLK